MNWVWNRKDERALKQKGTQKNKWQETNNGIELIAIRLGRYVLEVFSIFRL